MKERPFREMWRGQGWGLAGRGVSGGTGQLRCHGQCSARPALNTQGVGPAFLFTVPTKPSSHPTCTQVSGHSGTHVSARPPEGHAAGVRYGEASPGPPRLGRPHHGMTGTAVRSDVTLTPLAPGMSVHTSWGIRTWRVHPRPSGEVAWLVVTDRKG